MEAPRKKHFGRARARRVDAPVLSFLVAVNSIRRDKSVASPLFACQPRGRAKRTPAPRKGVVAESFAFSDVANLGDAS